MSMDLPAMGTVERARDQSGTLAQRISTSPDLADASAARARVNDWLDEIADTAAGKTLIRLFAAHSLLNTLISGLAEGSRYLWELVRADPQRLVSLLEAEPERRFDEILAADFLCSNLDGTLIDRAQFLAQTARPVTITGLVAEDVQIRLFGDVALIPARTRYRTADGEERQGRYTDAWARRDGRWLAIAAHVTR